MNFSLKQALKVFLIFTCAIGVASASIIITNKNNNNAKSKNDSLWNVVDGNNSSDGNNSNTDGKTLVSKTESQVNKYIDIDGDGTVDGIIFADLLIGGSGTWNEDNNPGGSVYAKYNITKISSSKDYYVSQKNYTNKLGGTADVLTPTGEGADRFYVMALEDYGEIAPWYTDASVNFSMSDYKTATSQNFGTGKPNTLTMIEKWNNEEYGEQNAGEKYNHLYTKDLWGQIQNKVNDGWFVPSIGELSAFGDALNITADNAASKGLQPKIEGKDTPFGYWSSSQANTGNSFYSMFIYGGNAMSGDVQFIRLATIA